MRKVLHVITSLRTGGAEKLIVDLLPKLRDLGDNVDLCVFDGIHTPFYEQLESLGIKIISLGINCNVYNPTYVFRLIFLMRYYDIIHTHNTACQFFVAIANCILRKRIITTEHSTSNRRRDYPLLRWLDCWMYRQYQAIVCVSDKTSQNITYYTNDRSLPVCTIENGIDILKYRNAVPSLDLEKIASHCHKCVMVAGFRYEKDHSTVIRSYRLLPENYHLFLVGDGVKRKEYEQMILDLGLTSRVHLLGVRADVPNILSAADIVVLSSHREGFGLAAVEGMASNKPVICSDVEGLHEIVNGYGVLVPHEDSLALANAIQRLTLDRQYAKLIAEKCVERAKMFDVNLTVAKYHQLYR